MTAGGTEHVSDIYTVSGAGTGFSASSTADEFHSVHQTISGNFRIVARVLSMDNFGAASRAGLQVRQSLNADSMHATLLLGPGEFFSEFMNRTSNGGSNGGTAHAAGEWLMLHRNGTELRGYTSHDGVNWMDSGGPVTLTGLSDPVYVGMVVASGSSANLARARFSNVAITTGTPNPPPQVSILVPRSGATFNPTTNIAFTASATDVAGGTISSVEFLSGSTVLGTATLSSGNYTYTWSNVAFGIYSIHARATDNGGAVTTSDPINIAVNPAGAVTLNPVHDAFVNDGPQAGTNFGTDGALSVRTSGTTGNNFESYLRFDTTGVSNITTATLRVYLTTPILQSSAPVVSLYPVSDNTWTETGITWNNKPSVGTLLRSSWAGGPSFYTFDVTSHVTSAGLFSFALVAASGNQLNFSSDETTSGARPELLLTINTYKGRAYAKPYFGDASTLFPLIASYMRPYEALPLWLDSLGPVTTENSVVQFQRRPQTLPADGQYVPDELLIQYEDGVNENAKAQARARVGGTTKEKIKSQTRRALERGADAGDLELVKLARGQSVMDAVRLLRNQPGVRFAEPNLIYHEVAVPNDPEYQNGSLWNMAGPSSSPSPNQYGSNAAAAWATGHTGSTTIYVGVIDTGVQVEHADLRQNAWTNSLDPVDGVDNDRNGFVDDTFGWDFANGDRTVYDDPDVDKHGTHVAGSIAAVGDNNDDVVGVSWRTTFIPAKALHNGGTTANLIKAIDYITDLKIRHGINIVATNNSWGSQASFSQALLDAITRGAKANILFIAAAGNGGSDGVSDDNDLVPFYPASYDTTAGAGYDAVIAVAAIGSTGSLASFSNYGPTSVDLGAPGDSVISTIPANPTATFGSESGTSMATPHVTGAASLYASMYRAASPAAIKLVLLDSARETPTTSLNGLTVTGGRLNIGFFGQ